MHLENTANACSYIDRISLIDNKGKSYKQLRFMELIIALKANLVQGHTLFSWEFEKLTKIQVQSVSKKMQVPKSNIRSMELVVMERRDSRTLQSLKEFGMKYLAFIALIVFIPAIYAKIQTKPSVKPNVALKRKKMLFPFKELSKNKINITEICIEKKLQKIELQVIIPYTMCSNISDIGLTDENGKSYQVIGMKISSCPEILQVNPGYKFYWSFEKLDHGISTLNLTENKIRTLTFPNWGSGIGMISQLVIVSFRELLCISIIAISRICFVSVFARNW